MNITMQSRALFPIVGLILVLISIYFLGRNLSSFSGEGFLWKSIVENISLVLVCAGIFMLVLLPLGSKYYSFPSVIMGIIGVFISGYETFSFNDLWELLICLTTMGVGYKLLLDSLR